MAYSKETFTLKLIGPTNDVTAPNLWSASGPDVAADVQVDGYIADAYKLGLKADDLLFYNDLTSGGLSHLRVTAINADGSANLSDAVALAAADAD